MSTQARRVLARFKAAVSIGNVHDILAKWQVQLNAFARFDWQGLRELEDPDDLSTRALYEILHFPARSFNELLGIGIRELFFAVLQQYELPLPALKKIEQYSKFYARKRMGRAKDLDHAIELGETLMQEYREQFETTKEILTTAQLRGTDIDGAKVLQAGPFKVVNTGGFDQAVMEKVARVVEEAVKRLQAKGLGQVCYGDVLVSKNIRKRHVLAFYHTQADEMFVRADLKGHEGDALKTVLHELGHRLAYKFLSSKMPDMQRMYEAIKRGQATAVSEAASDPESRPRPGDSIVDPKSRRTYIVDAVDYYRRSYRVRLHRRDEPEAKASIGLDGYLAMKGVAPTSGALRFISNYAGKNADENFAEMVAAYCLGDLPDEQVTMLLPIIS